MGGYGCPDWSFEGRREDIGELSTFFGKGRLDDDAVDVLQIGDLLQGVVFGVVFEDLVEGVADEQSVLELGQFSQFVQLVPALYLVVCN